MHWELWDTESNNLVETFATEAEALQGVREILAVNRPDYIDFLVLGAMYDEGEPQHEEPPPVLAGAELQSRLAEGAQAAAAATSRKVHERIRKWMAEEGWHIDDIKTPGAIFHIMAKHRNDWAISVAQDGAAPDRVVIMRSWYYDEPVKSMLQHLDDSSLNDLVWNIYRDTSIMGVDFHGVDTPTSGMYFQTYVYSDGCTKDNFVHKVHLTNRAFMLALRTFVRALQASSHSRGKVLSPEDLHPITRLVPPSRGPLTAAS